MRSNFLSNNWLRFASSIRSRGQAAATYYGGCWAGKAGKTGNSRSYQRDRAGRILDHVRIGQPGKAPCCKGLTAPVETLK